MKTVEIKVPDFVEMTDAQLREMMASRLYEKGTVTLGQAAEMCGLTKEEMMWKLGDYGVSFYNYTTADIIKDLENAQRYSI